MSRPFPTMPIVQSSLELLGIGLGAYLSSLEGAENGGYFLMGIHAIFLFAVIMGLLFYYPNYTLRIAAELKLIFAGLFFFSMTSMGIYFYFIVKISDPNVFDILLTNLGFLTFLVLAFYIAKLVCFTMFAYQLYPYITGVTSEESEAPTPAESKAATPKVPLYLLDYEKMCGKK